MPYPTIIVDGLFCCKYVTNPWPFRRPCSRGTLSDGQGVIIIKMEVKEKLKKTMVKLRLLEIKVNDPKLKHRIRLALNILDGVENEL